MFRLTCAGVVLLLCLILSASAYSAELGATTTWSSPPSVENFTNPSGELSNPGTGGNPGGFLRGTRTGSPNVNFRPAGYLRDNWGRLFGTMPGVISFDVKALDSYQIPEVQFALTDGSSSFTYIITTQNVVGHPQTAADGWKHYSIPWQATWDNATAKAQGWRVDSPFGEWAKAIQNPVYSVLSIVGSGTGPTDQTVGIDNFHVDAGLTLEQAQRALVTASEVPRQISQKAPVVDYTFDEGNGDVLHDRSGNGADAKISGATWVRNGGRWALEFDGAQSSVNCGSPAVMSLRDALTLEAWVYAEPIYSVWQSVPILGNGRYGFLQTVHDVLGSAGGSARGLMPFRTWVYLAESWDGKELRFYVDGTLVSRVKAEGSVQGGDFILGPQHVAVASENEPASYTRRFKGKIASMRLYNRALTYEEILADLRTTNITNSPMPMPILQPGLGRVKVEVDAARLGKPLGGISVTLELLKANAAGAQSLSSVTVKEFDKVCRAVVDLSVPELAKGEYVVRATAKEATGNIVGVPGEETVSWPGSAKFPSGSAGGRRLNNLVTELLSVPGPDSSGVARKFEIPRTGFIFISNHGSKEVKIASEAGGGTMSLILSKDYDDAFETMRYLPKGSYTIATADAKNLVVRAVAMTMYDYAYTEGSDSVPYGTYAGEFEERYVFPHMNVFLVHDFNARRPFAEEWKAKGRRMLSTVTTAVTPKGGQSKVDAACDVLAGDLGFTMPLYSGIMVDEFANSDPGLPVWSDALERLRKDPRFKEKVLHAWDYALYDLVTWNGGADGRKFFQTLRACDSPVQWECYVDYERTELHALRHMNDKIVGELRAAEQAFAPMADNVIVVPYSFVTGGPPWITMTLPNVDSRTYLEMQVRLVATDPAYAGVRGLGVYRSCYSDEETVRWTARLFRHYAIEGHTEPLGKDPYLLTHLQNPEFEEEGSGWTVRPAEQGSIRFAIYPQFGTLQGRYPSPTQGDTVIVTRRSDKGPNVFSQEITGLEPGRLYSFRMCSADFNDLSRKEQQAVSVDFGNAELLPEKCFTYVAKARRANSWVNWYVRIFRAKGTTATLTVSDWGMEKEPLGPIGQQLMFNFIKVQPYWAP